MAQINLIRNARALSNQFGMVKKCSDDLVQLYPGISLWMSVRLNPET
jgi:hypothetical protein